MKLLLALISVENIDQMAYLPKMKGLWVFFEDRALVRIWGDDSNKLLSRDFFFVWRPVFAWKCFT